MVKKIIARMSIIAIVALISLISFAFVADDGNTMVLPKRTSIPPKIDGNLDDDIWQQAQLLNKDFIAFEPVYGEVLPQKTVVRMAYDSKNLYVALHCYDTEPEKIKTSITKRDNIWNDDWAGIYLDSLGSKQSAYGFMVNPNGIQADGLDSAVSGRDVSPDFVWYSAGRVTDNGYQVEIRIPLRSIRYKRGKSVKMGILFIRYISRLGMSGSWPEVKPGSGMLNAQAPAVFRDLKAPLNLELLPNIVYGRNNERKNPDGWGKTDVFHNIGVGIKYGIASSVTADITINPDFSQVESDAFQTEVNRRYPIFYSEKRPFFMEGTDVYNFFVMPQGHMMTAVHTRRIVDPNWGAKLTGALGKATFGILSAADQWPGLAWNGEVNPYEGNSAYFTIARGKYSLGGDNYIGGLYSGREFADGYNRVVGADLMHRFFTHHQASLSLLQSYSREPDGEKRTSGSGLNCYYIYDTKPFIVQAGYERYGAHFQMDSAFQRRTGISNGYIWIAPKFYPNPKKISWLKLIRPQFIAQYLHDYTTNMNDKYLSPQIILNFTRQGYVQISYGIASESWVNQTFDQYYIEMYAGAQLTKWLNLTGSFIRGDRIYYDMVDPYLGWGTTFGMDVTVQPSKKLNQYFGFYYTDFYRKSNDEKIYEVNIVNSRTTYQFNKYFFVRAILQYDSYQHKLLTDFLGSCTVIPGTVLHLGYGALYEKREWQHGQWINTGFGYMHNMKRSLFFKASYLFRF
jgi:hypothetical protein